MKKITALTLTAILMLAQTGCGEPLMIEDATEKPVDSSTADSDASGQTGNAQSDKANSTNAVASILGQINSKTGDDESENADTGKTDELTENFVPSNSKDVYDLVPYDTRVINPNHDDESDTIQLRINIDSRDHTISSLRFWIDGTINDITCELEEFDLFSGAYACDLNFTDSLSNIITVFTSSRTGRHQTTVYSFADDKMNRVDSIDGFIDFMSIDGAGDFSVTEATNIQSDTYGTMYVRKKYQTSETYSYDVRDSIQELTLTSNTVGYYPEENHFAIGYPFSLKNTLTLYVNGSETYTTGTLPVNFRGVLKEMLLEEDKLNSKVFLVEPEDGWTDSETNINSPIYAPNSAGSENFDPDNYKGWVSYTELSEVANEGFSISD